jgi:undecaprenyl diphosphate synthase
MQSLLDDMKLGDPARALALALDPVKLPAHLAIIMDGNGRWAERRGLPRIAGHRNGTESVRVAVKTCAQLGIPYLTLYAFSTENWRRPADEVELLWSLLRQCLRHEIDTLQRNNVRLNAFGRLDGLPRQAREDLEAAMAATRQNTRLQLNLAINYSGRTEIVDAMNRMLAAARRNGTLGTLQIDEASLSQHLDSANLPDPDLLIRTSGELRVSNFLLWQIAYTELYVTDTCWPDFGRMQLLEAILAFQRRQRRFGGVSGGKGDRVETTEAVGASAS